MTHSTPPRPDWSDFAQDYEAEILPILSAQEARRARLHRWRWIARIGAIALTAGIVALWVFVFPDETLLLIPTILALGAGLAGAQMVGGGFSEEINALIVGAIAARYRLTYDRAGAGLAPGDFRTRGVVAAYDRSNLEDAFTGEIDGLKAALTEAHLEKRQVYIDSRGRSRTRYVTVFQGLLIRFEVARSAAAAVHIRRDAGAVGNAIGGWFRETFSDDQRIRLEDPVFEKEFEVYSTDQVAARRGLTPRALLAFTRFRDLAPGRGDVQASFDGPFFWLAIDSRTDAFEAGSISRSLTDPSRARTVVEEIAVLWDVAALLRETG